MNISQYDYDLRNKDKIGLNQLDLEWKKFYINSEKYGMSNYDSILDLNKIEKRNLRDPCWLLKNYEVFIWLYLWHQNTKTIFSIMSCLPINFDTIVLQFCHNLRYMICVDSSKEFELFPMMSFYRLEKNWVNYVSQINCCSESIGGDRIFFWKDLKFVSTV